MAVTTTHLLSRVPGEFINETLVDPSAGQVADKAMAKAVPAANVGPLSSGKRTLKMVVGLVAGDGGAVIWPLLVGPNKAKELMMTGDLMTGDDLLRLGIANHVVPPEEVMEKAMERANALAALPPYALRATKNLINKMIKQQAELVLDIGLSWEWLSMAKNDHKEAATAWVEKREPNLTGT